MASSHQITQAKRNRERAQKEKRQEKMAKRALKKTQPKAPNDESGIASPIEETRAHVALETARVAGTTAEDNPSR